MRPIDFSQATWREIQGRLISLRASVYEALLEHGPCTTRELAHAAEIDLLTVRPRITELVQLGFVECLDEGGRGHEGRYRALTAAEAERLFEARQKAAQNPQLEFALS